MREVFEPIVSRDRYSSGSNQPLDTSRDTGASVEFRPGHGGCDQPTRHSYTVQRPGGEPDTVEIDDKVLPTAYGVSVSPQADFVVGQFSVRQEPDPRTLADFKARGIVGQDAQRLSHYGLVQVPVTGGFLDPLRRRHWLVSPKVLTQLPEHASGFDVGPDKSIAVGHENRVLRWTRREGLNPWLEFSQPVQSVEYLSDGSLGVAVGSGYRRSFYCVKGDQSTEVPFATLYPERYERELRDQTASVAFLQDSDSDERARFLESCDWLQGSYGWKTHRVVPAPDKDRVAVTIVNGGWNSTDGHLHVYERGTGQAVDLGPLHHPDSQRANGTAQDANSRLTWSGDGNWLVHLSVPKFDGAPVDVTVFAADGSGSHLVPGVRNVEVKPEGLSLRIPSGQRIELPYDQVPDVQKEPWYARARMLDLFDDLGGDEGQTIEMLEDAVVVGDELLPHRLFED